MSTGHQHHFLSRLDRVSLPHVERALALYNDHELVHFILSRVTLPEGAARVAISLDDAVRGPFVVVTREGRFVTCLGEGMKPGRLPIVTRERVDGIAERHMSVRERLDAARAFGGVSALLKRLYDAGEDLSREEMIAASQVAPLLARELFEFIATASRSLLDSRATISSVLVKTDKPKPYWHTLLSAYYKTFWCAQHFLVLFSSIGREIFEAVPAERLRKLGGFLTQLFFIHHRDSHGARAVWAVGKLGKCLLPNYKAAWAASDKYTEVVDTTLALAEIGHRHRAVRAEVRKLIASMPPRFGRDGHDRPRRAVAEAMIKLSEIGFISPEVALIEHRGQGARHAIWLGEQMALPAGHRYRFTRPEEVPDSLALPLAIARGACFLEDLRETLPLFMALPWMARAKAEDLYMPRDYVRELYTVPWTPDLTIGWFRESVALEKRVRGARPEGPARNGPCPCGSGKKYKRCCGEAG